jgi:adenylate kinase
VPDLNLVLLGPPGAGKGTQAKPLAAQRGLAYISSGDLLRGAAAAGSPAGRAAERYMNIGDLVPDELVFALLEEAMPPEGFILDGVPRTTGQADALDCRLERLGQTQPHAVVIDVADEVLVDRLAGRRICARHGHEYHIAQRPPRHAGTCDIDGSPLIGRADDEPATAHGLSRADGAACELLRRARGASPAAWTAAATRRRSPGGRRARSRRPRPSRVAPLGGEPRATHQREDDQVALGRPLELARARQRVGEVVARDGLEGDECLGDGGVVMSMATYA